MRRVGTVVAAIVLALGMVGSVASPATASALKLRLTSPAFRAGAEIPDGFTCDGADASPPLRWRTVPKGTVELALVMEDPDATIGNVVHWVAWGIDPAVGQLPEQILPAGVREGSNGARRLGYTGPCPPHGGGPHRYRFTLYALHQHVSIAIGATAAELRTAIRGTLLATARLVGRYER